MENYTIVWHLCGTYDLWAIYTCMRYSVLKRKMNFLSLTKIWSVLNNAWNKGEFLRSCFFLPCCWLVLKKWQSKYTTFFSEAWCKEWIKIITQLRIMSNKQFLELLYSTHYTLVFITGTLCYAKWESRWYRILTEFRHG